MVKLTHVYLCLGEKNKDRIEIERNSEIDQAYVITMAAAVANVFTMLSVNRIEVAVNIPPPW
jgi:citrate lyase gamma subunit